MARPRKMTTEQMLEIVDAYQMYEAAGNTELLKCSLIAVYAEKAGYDADGYDFRRNTEVRSRIAELKKTNGVFCGTAPAVYKSLDAEEFLRCNCGTEQLKKALLEMDAYWKCIFEHAANAVKQNRSIGKAKTELEKELLIVAEERDALRSKAAELSKRNHSLTLENRYLRSMLKTYLYPGVANEILRSEKVSVPADTQVTKKAMLDLSEQKRPESFCESTVNDRELLSDEERILKMMWEQCDV